MEAAEIVDTLVPVIERAIARRLEEVFGAIEQLREEFQTSVGVLDGNDHALVAEIQRLRGSGGEQVAETLARAGQAWERFITTEAKLLGLQIIVPKAVKEADDDAV